MPELFIDYNIRTWVFVPIVLITLLVGIFHHYFAILMAADKTVDLLQIQDSQAIRRSSLLRENGKFLPSQSYSMRKYFFNDAETGYFKAEKRSFAQTSNSPTLISALVKGNITNALPMMFIGGWINWIFSGFVTTRVPFPLTLDFKSMLQQGIYLESLDASWVSSLSWYFLNVFGLRPILNLILREERPLDKLQQQNDAMVYAALSLPEDSQIAFKAEWEALEIVEYRNALIEYEELFTKKILVQNNEKMPSIEQKIKKIKSIKKKKRCERQTKNNDSK